MSKETFYFSHDYNARADRKIVNVIMKHGMTGIGVYWCLVEMLYEEGGYMPTEYERISFELRTDTKVIQSIINDFELFKTDLDKFWSDAVLERLQERCDKSEKARESINKRWNKYRNNTNVIRSNDKRNTIKERKEEEIKKDNNNTWRDSFEVYLTECKQAYKLFMEDCDIMKEQIRLNPGVNVPLTIEKGFKNFWGTDVGWKHKKKSKCKDINWSQTIINSISSSLNKIYGPRNVN